ncbi:NACHT domain-containing protein [Lentzea jiangxiensis]|uniref:NACHT domain-containing protein n=1 Tax=Lentzea jiangxiensis TaxID=641025 RepID=UPI0015A036C8|nr:NACHT domain-containing protein [Lentzea jiangxiensis]
MQASNAAEVHLLAAVHLTGKLGRVGNSRTVNSDHLEVSRIRGRAPLLSVIAIVVGLAGLVWFLFTRRDDLLSRLNSIAGITSLVIAILSLVVTVAGVVVAIRSSRPAGAPDQARDRLRCAVRQQWDREIGIRKLRTPRPLRLTWAPSPRDNVTARVIGAPAPSGGLTLRAGARPTVELMRQFRELPSRRLVVLGEAGAGKSVLAMLLTVDLLTEPQDNDPVPVLLPIAGWDPTEELGSWLSRRVHEEYPDVISASGAAELVAGNQVMAVLDGLDEMPKALMPQALAAIDAASEGLWIVLTCRGAEYEKLTAQRTPLSRAAVVEIEPIDPDDAGVYLRDNEAVGDPRWLPVVSRMHTDNGKNLAKALSTPLMLSLARDAYRAPASTPADLLTIADQGADAVTHRVLTEFLPAVYSRTEAGQRAYPAAKAERWLRTLANHLADRRTDGVNLYWWQLDRAVPARLVGLFIAVVLVVLGTPAVFGSVLIMGGRLNAALGFGLACPLLAAAIAGPGTGRAVLSTPTRWIGLAVVSAALRDGLLATLAFCSVIVFLDDSSEAQLNNLDYLAELSQPALVFMLVGTAMGVITNGLAMTRSATPTRPSLSRRDLARAVLSGMGTAALVGLPVAATAGAIVGVLEDSLPRGLQYGGIVAAAAVGGLGLVVGIARALASPVANDQARSARSVVFGDAITLALVTSITAVAGGIAMWLVTGLSGQRDAPELGLLTGIVLAVVVAVGSGAPWVRFRAAQALLALRGRLPWRVIRFLEDAHRREVLRQSGGSYQFRHDLVQAHLTTARPQSRPPHGGLTRRAIHTTIALLVLAATTATITVPSLREAIETRTHQRASTELQARIEREPDARIKVRLALALATIRPTDVDLAALKAVRGEPTIAAPPNTSVQVDGTTITAVHDRTIWRLDSGTSSMATLPARPRTFSAGGDRVITMDTGTATVWRWHAGDLLLEYTTNWTSATVAPDGRHAIVRAGRTQVFLVDLTSQAETPLGLRTSTAPTVQFIANGHALVSDRAVAIVVSFAGETSRSDIAAVWASAPNGHSLVRLLDGHTEFWNATTGARRDLGQPVTADLSADGRWAFLHFNNRSQLLDLSGVAPTQELPFSAHLTDDREHVATTTADTTEIRSLATNKVIATLPRAVPTRMTVASDAGILAIETMNGTQLHALGPNSRPKVLLSDRRWDVPRVVGDSILIKSAENGISVWPLSLLRDLDYDSDLGLACQVAEGGFTESEWEQHIPALPYVSTCPSGR